ncbi:MAG: acyl carrier protein [Methylacidiphilales bacterium]|nr:acyl carrier protein [Candidatus Methylacidiphilales bacterium]
MDSIEERLRKVVIDTLVIKPDELKLESSFETDLGADSLSFVELSMAVEEEFDITIPEEDAEKLTSFQKLLEYIKSAKPNS